MADVACPFRQDNAGWKKWIEAARLRTLPLSSSGVVLGAGLAALQGNFRFSILLFSVLTAVFLQILSNFANDYGDAVKGSDGPGRAGPRRAVASGAISAKSMLCAIMIMAALCIICTIILLYFSFYNDLEKWMIFLALCLVCIAAAMLYTMGRHPYGYMGLGDLFVFIFFGLAAVMGSYALYNVPLSFFPFLPACATGFFATAVLNINNIRDMDNDKLNGKKTLAARLGDAKARLYHLAIIGAGLSCWIAWFIYYDHSAGLFFLLLAMPLIRSGWLVYISKSSAKLDAQLRVTSISAGFFNLCMAIIIPLL